MCTVTFIPVPGGFHLTSNRDENPGRSAALLPATYLHKGVKHIYPKDPQAGGTWITIKENGDTAVLLNGAFVNHQRQLLYRKSRGLIFIEIISDADPHQRFTDADLSSIEPFTIIFIRKGTLTEYRWDGALKHARSLNISKPYIWSSATLYNDDAVKQRQHWFDEWLTSANELTTENILSFHEEAGRSDPHNALVMNRGDRMQTVSITSVSISQEVSRMFYRDLRSRQYDQQAFIPAPAAAGTNRSARISSFFRTIKIRLLNWEYWPAYLIYGPPFFYWCWLSLKARSFFFFSAANPGITHSGFVQEKKSEIYPLIPPRYYPRTKLCRPGRSIAGLLRELKSDGLKFPLIAKPDIGQKGIQVKLLQDETQLRKYNEKSAVDFLIQEYIPYEMEAGIFYYRLPGESTGHLSGIVGKEFLELTGDGTSSLETLLQKDDRHFLQLSTLRKTDPEALLRILPAGVKKILVPYGNHSRGAKFIDLSDKITDELTKTIDNMCRQIPGFYYGRLDIRFRTWEELAKGLHFSVIEINGAGSEPTHMYDPSHSIFFAWREICRHWKLMYTISKMNCTREGTTLMGMQQGLRMIREHFRYQRKLGQQRAH